MYTTKEQALVAIKKDAFNFQFVSDTLKGDARVALFAIKQNPETLEYIGSTLKNDKAFIINLLKSKLVPVRKIELGNALKINKPFFVEALDIDRTIFHHASDLLKNDKAFILKLITQKTPNIIGFASQALQDDKELMIEAVKRDGQILQYIGQKKFNDDTDVVNAAVGCTGMVLQYASPRLRKNRDIVLNAVSSYGYGLKYADDSLTDDEEIVLTAVSNSGSALQFASTRLKKQQNIVLAAVSNRGDALQFADKAFSNNKEIVLAALNNSSNAFPYIDERFKKDKAIALLAVQNGGFVLRLLNYPLRVDKEVVLAALQNNIKVIQYVDDELLEDEDILNIINESTIAKIIVDSRRNTQTTAVGAPIIVSPVAVSQGENLVDFSLSLNKQRESVSTLVTFSPDGEYFAHSIYASQGETEYASIAYVWNLKKHTLNRAFSHKGQIKDLKFSPDGKLLATILGNNILIWDIQKNKLIHTLIHEYELNSISFNPQVQTIASTSAKSGIIRLWSLKSGQRIKSFLAHDPIHYGGLNTLAFSSDGKILAASFKNTLKWWDTDQYTLLRTHNETKDNDILSFFLDEAKQHIIYGTLNAELKALELYKESPVKPLKATGYLLSPDKKTTVNIEGYDPRQFILKDTKTGRLLTTFKTQTLYAFGLSYSPDSKLVVFDNGNLDLTMVDVETQKVIGKIFGGITGNWLWQSPQDKKYWRSMRKLDKK